MSVYGDRGNVLALVRRAKWRGIDVDYEKNNYLVNPDGTTLNSKISLTIPQGTTATDKITLTDELSDSSGYSSDNFSFDINDQRNWTSRISTTFDVDYFSTGSTFAALGGTGTANTRHSTNRIDVHLQAQDDIKQATASIEYLQAIPIGRVMLRNRINAKAPIW